jgi:hypothetical protein
MSKSYTSPLSVLYTFPVSLSKPTDRKLTKKPVTGRKEKGQVSSLYHQQYPAKFAIRRQCPKYIAFSILSHKHSTNFDSVNKQKKIRD